MINSEGITGSATGVSSVTDSGKASILELSKADRVTIFVTMVLLFCCIGVVAHAKSRVELKTQVYQRAKSQARSSVADAHQYFDNLAFWKKNHRTYFKWVDAGRIGSVEEMDWIELMLKTSAQTNAQNFTYRLDAAESLEKFYGRVVQHNDIRVTRINLEFELNHGGDLFGFFEQIFSHSPSAFELSELKIERMVRKDQKKGNRTRTAGPIALNIGESAERSRLSNAGSLSGNGPAVGSQSEYGGIKVQAAIKWFAIQAVTDASSG